MDRSPLGPSVNGILQSRILEWVAISISRGSSQSRDWTCISCISCNGRQILYCWATKEARLRNLYYSKFICEARSCFTIVNTSVFLFPLALDTITLSGKRLCPIIWCKPLFSPLSILPYFSICLARFYLLRLSSGITPPIKYSLP